MSKPIVAIVGRPNVGKSTFFNYLAGKRISITDDTPGVTRDRIYADCEWRSRQFILIDTGGIEPFTGDDIMMQMKRQAEMAVDSADAILFMVDFKEGITANDMEIADMLRRAGKPVLVVVNKVDRVGNMPNEVYEFYNLGLGEISAVSSEHGLGMGDMLDEVFKLLPEKTEEVTDEEAIKTAIIGKPNVGKSSLINRILGEERLIVSDIPGTTRDAIDTFYDGPEGKFMFIDTAGIRKKSKINESIEHYSVMRAWTAITRSDVCVLMVDAVDGVTEQDTKIAGFAHEEGKASVIAVNKWDLLDKETGTLETYEKKVHDDLAFMTYAPVVFISVKNGQRVDKLLELVKHVNEQSALRVTTGMLNDLLNEAIAIVQPPSDKGKRLKIYYMTQVGIKPPTFVCFVNNADLMHYSYQRYLENHLRRTFGFEGTPIKIIIREKGRDR